MHAFKPHPLDASLPETHTSKVQPPDSVAAKKKVVSATHKAMKKVNGTLTCQPGIQNVRLKTRGLHFTGSNAGIISTLVKKLDVPTCSMVIEVP